MSKRKAVVLQRLAELDVVAIVGHLEAERSGLGLTFADALEAELASLATGYLAASVAHPRRKVRRSILSKPWTAYAVFFTVEKDVVRVLLVMHMRRDIPRHLSSR